MSGPAPFPAAADPWADPPLAAASPAGRRAARWVWLLAAVEGVLSLCVVGALGVIAGLSPPAWEQMLSQAQVTGAQRQELELVRGSAAGLAVLYAVLGLLPALLLAAAGFGVWRGRRWAAWLALVLVGMQVLVVLPQLAFTVVNAALAGVPMQLTMAVLVGGTMLALLGATLRALWAVRRGASAPAADADPWASEAV